ncbi:DUF6087 family protein [Streptomyces virginiae]|uniref:DUF6087 family protein n=1 Tax=Streptomyces virginiae TaxID=1961 RepID=UPI00338FD9B4
MCTTSASGHARDGFQWVTVTVVDDYAAACRLLHPAPRSRPQEQSAPGKRGGRHRKPRA